jgi:hypothetical protein
MDEQPSTDDPFPLEDAHPVRVRSKPTVLESASRSARSSMSSPESWSSQAFTIATVSSRSPVVSGRA